MSNHVGAWRSSSPRSPRNDNRAAAERALIIGYNGGVGSAVLSALQKSKPGERLLQGLDEIFLADQEAPAGPIPLESSRLLPPVSIRSGEELGRMIRELGLTQVIDLSSTDTVDCTQVCDELDANFLCTSVEEWPERGSYPTDAAIARLKPANAPELTRRSHLVGSGANPGIVNALVFAAMEEMARRTGAEPTVEALDLHSILITEEDTTHEPGVHYDADVFPMTWSPEHCLEELFEPRSFVASHGRVVDLGHRPVERLYRARCGDRIIDAMAVPHEETKTLIWRFPKVEIAFLYRIPEAARNALAAHPEWDASGPWKTHRLFPPTTTRLVGRDRVGILLCSRTFGELWMGFDTDVSQGSPYRTNATELQVAAGVIAGWKQLDREPGIHFVEDLDWRRFLGTASEILGQPVIFHDPDAKPISIAERAVGDLVRPKRSDRGEKLAAAAG